MKKSTWVIIATAVVLAVLFFKLAMLAYPRVVQWLLAGVENDYVVVVNEVPASYPIIAALFIALSALIIGVGVFFANKNRGVKNAVKIGFVLLDVALLSMLGWLAFLKYRLMGEVSDYSEMLASVGSGMTLPLEDVRLYEVGLFACVAVGVSAWMFSKKKKPQAT